MFEILPESTDRCIGFASSGKVSASDYERLLPLLDAAIATHGTINLLAVMTDFDGWADVDATKADFRFGWQEYCQVKQAAFVVDSKWMKHAVNDTPHRLGVATFWINTVGHITARYGPRRGDLSFGFFTSNTFLAGSYGGLREIHSLAV